MSKSNFFFFVFQRIFFLQKLGIYTGNYNIPFFTMLIKYGFRI